MTLDKSNTMEELKNAAMNKIFKAVAVFGCVAVPASLSRFSYMGWQPAFFIQLIAWIACLHIYMKRNHYSSKFKATVLVVCASVVTIAGSLTFGLLGNYLVWALMVLVLSQYFISTKITPILVTIFLLSYALSGYRYVELKEAVVGGADLYNSSLQSWVVVLFGVGLMAFVILTVIGTLHREVADLIEKLRIMNIQLSEKNLKIEYQATHDILTGLPTLKLANEHLESALNSAKEKNEKSAVLFLDLDGFKFINDTHGHEAGDYVLKVVSNRIKDTIREIDTACRIGGDEFLVVLACISDYKEMENICKRLIEVVDGAIAFKQKQLNVGVSIGGAIFPNHASTPLELKRIADHAMYEVKRSGKNNYNIAQ